jgi:hypothetical protein
MRIAEKEMMENQETAGCNEKAAEGTMNRAPTGKMRPENGKKRGRPGRTTTAVDST